MECSESELVLRIWDLPVRDMTGIEVKIHLFLTRGNGFFLLGNEICHQCYLFGPKKLLLGGVMTPVLRNRPRKQ